MSDSENSSRSQQPQQPTDGRTENTVTAKLSMQHHLSVEIEETQDNVSPVTDALEQPLHQAPLFVHETRVPMAPATIGDLPLGSPGPELPLRSLSVNSSSSVGACSELSFEGPAESVSGCRHGDRPPSLAVVDNEPAHQLVGILHTTRSAVLCRTVTMKADDCTTVVSGSNVVEIEDKQDIANSLSHEDESVRNGTPGEWSYEARSVPAPGTSTTGVTISLGGRTSDVTHGQADDTLDAQRPVSQSVADREEVNQVKMDDHKARNLDSTLLAEEINADLNAPKLPDRFGADVTSQHPPGATKSGSKTQDGEEELKIHVRLATSTDSIHLEAKIQNTAGVAKVSSGDGICIDDIENAPAKFAAKTTSSAGVFETYKTEPTPEENETSHAEDALKPPLNNFNKQVPAPHSKTFHVAATPETFVPSVGNGRKVVVAAPGDKRRSQEPLSATQQEILRSKPPRFVRLESTVTEEESLELHPEQSLQQRYTSQMFRATSSNTPFGQVIQFENSSLAAFDNTNLAPYNSSTPGPLIDDLLNSPRLPSEQNPSEASFLELETRACSLQFADSTGLRKPETSATDMTPGVTSSQMSIQVGASAVPPAQSMTGYDATQEVVVISTDVSSPSPFCSAVRSDAFDESSSSSAQADGFQVSKQCHLFGEHEALATFTNDVQSNGPSNRFISAELGVPLAPMYNGPPTWKTEAKAAANGQQQRVLDRGENLLRNHQADTSAALPPTASTDTGPKQSFVQQFGYNLQGGDQDWMPYSRYKVPSKDLEKNFVTADAVPFQPYFLMPALRGNRHGVRIPQVQAVVATATGQFPSPRGIRAPRGLPPLVWRNRPFYRPRAPSAYREKRYGYPLNPHGMPESRGLRAAMSAQHTLRTGTNFGQTQRRSLYPNNGMMQPLQHTAMSPNYAGVQYWDNTPYKVTSCQGGYYGGVNPEGSPFFFNTSGRSPSAEVASRRRTKLDQRIAGRQHVLQAGSLSTFDSHIDVDEPLTLKQRTSVAFKKWPSSSEQKATSAKKVQTEPRHTSATHSTVLDNTGQKIIKPRARRHVGIDDSNTDLRHIPYTRATTQTEHSIPSWTTTGSPHQPNVGDAIHFHAFCEGTPSPRYINQNVVCPQYPPYIHPNLQTPAPVQFVPSAERHLPPSVAQPPYYAPTQLQGNPAVNQPIVVPKKTPSSPERAAACPLSSCFRKVSHCGDYDSEEKPRKPRRCHHSGGKRSKSPLPPPFASSSKFSLGYVMNSENELNPILVPLNAPTAPLAISVARSAGTTTVAVQSHVASSSSMTEEDPVAELQVRVQKQLVQIEKAIKEQDMRRKEEAKKRDKLRGNKLNEDKRAKGQRNKTTGGSNPGKNPHNIENAETPESSSSSDSQPEPSSWFSWSRTSKSRKGEKHRITHKQLTTSVPSVGKETEDESRSYYTSIEKAMERRERTAIPGASSNEASRDHPTFAWSMRRKTPENQNIQSSGEAFRDRPTFAWTTRKKAGQDRSVQSSPRGSIFQKEASTRERERSPPRVSPKSCDTSPNESPKRRNAPSPQRSTGRRTAESAWRTRPHKNSSSPVRSELLAERSHSYDSDPRADASLLEKRRVSLPAEKRTQRRWSRIEMHRSTSYDTAASSVPPSSTKERRTRSEEQFKVQRSPKPKSNTASSWWASMCSLFKGPNQPESPSPKTKQLSAEDTTERSGAAEKKASSGGGMLSGIFNWFPSRSADKPKKARRRSAGSKEDSSSSFKEWITEKERALKKAQAEINARKKMAQKRQGNAVEGESEIPEDPYFVDDGGSRWAIRSSPSPSESVSHSPKYESATVEVVTPYMPPGPSTYGAPVSLVRCTFGDSRERPAAVPLQQQSGLTTSADHNWSLQYIYGGPGMEVPVTQGKPTSPVADSNVPPLYTFRDEPDWVLRITQGRERSKSSVGSATSQRAYPRKSSLSAEWKMEEPSFTARPTEVQSGQRKGSITASLSERLKKKRSSVSFEDDKEGGTPSQWKPQGAPGKSTYTQESAQPPPAVVSPMAPAIAPAPVPPLGFNTEESFKHEFYEEMDERGRAALSAPAYERRSSIHETTASAAAKMAAIDALFNSRSGKTSDITGEYGGASTTADHPLSRIALQPEKCSVRAETQRSSLKPRESLGAEPSQPPTPEKRIGVAKAGRRSSAPETASAAAAATNAENKDANDEKFKAAAFAPLAPGDPTHTNYVLQQSTPRKLQLNQPLSHECPTVQEVAGYAIVTAVVLLGLVLLVSVPRMRFHAVGM